MEKKLTTQTKIKFAMGDIYTGGFFNLINFYYAIFLTDIMRVNPVWAGTIFLVSKIWDAITDPLMGVITDNTHSKFGRRRPYFLYGIPLIALSFILMWWPIGFKNEILQILYYAFFYMLSNTVATFVQVPFIAMSAEISTDYEERNSISSIRMIISLLSSLVCAILPMIITGMFDNVFMGYKIMAIFFGLLFSIPWLITFYSTKEDPDFEIKKQSFSDALKSMTDTHKIKSFRILCYMYICIFVVMDLISMIMAYFMNYIILKPEHLSTALGTLLIAEAMSIIVANKFAGRFGKEKAIAFGSFLWIIACLATLLFNSQTPVIYVYVLAIFVGFAISLPLIGIISLFGDVTDVGELFLNQRLEGSFSGVQQFIRKCASGLANAVALAAIGFAGFINPIEKSVDGMVTLVNQVQPETVITTIHYIFAFIPLILLSICIYFALNWKLNEENQHILIEYLDLRRNNNYINSTLENQITEMKKWL